MEKVKIKNESRFQKPEYAHKTDSGMDIRANLDEPLTLQPGDRYAVPTGIYVELPEDYEIQIRPRSGLALKRGLTVLNTPGTIDAKNNSHTLNKIIGVYKNNKMLENDKPQSAVNKY